MSLARVASRQHGLVTLPQALACGLSYEQVRARVRAGRLVGCGRALYRIGGAPRTWEQRALAACLAAGGGAVLCGRSAASVWRLDLPAARQVEVASVGRRAWRLSSAETHVRRVRALETTDCTHVGSLPVTTVPRTILDLAGALDPGVLRRVLDDALVRRMTSPAQVKATLARLGGSGRSGTPALRLALEPWLEGAELDSVAEAAALRTLLGAGIPVPVCQHAVLRADGAPAVLDFAWPDRLVALEVDGFRWHASVRAHARDSARTNGLAALGWTVLRATPTELAGRPAGVLAALRTHLRCG